MDFDPLTEAFPTRTAQEEEEADAEANAISLTAAPLICWSNAAKEAIVDGKLRPSLMVVAIGSAACTLLHHCTTDSRKVLGSIALPETSMSGNSLTPSPSDSSCFVYSISSGGASDVVLVSCQCDVHPDRSHAFARGLLGSLEPARTVVLGSAPASEVAQVPGRDGGGDTPVLALETDAWRAADASEGPRAVPLMPSGSVVGGLPARLLSSCQARQWRACALILRQPRPRPDAASLQIMCSAARGVLDPLGSASETLGLKSEESLRRACTQAEATQWESGITGSVYL